MTDSTVLSVWGFARPNGAERFGLQLSRRGQPMCDAGLVCWPPDRARPLTWQARELGDDRRLAGAFWGLLFATVFLLPLSSDADHDVVIPDLEDIGLPESFLSDVRRHVVAGTSALFSYDLATADGAAGQMPSPPVRIARSVLSVEQQLRLHRGFDD